MTTIARTAWAALESLQARPKARSDSAQPARSSRKYGADATPSSASVLENTGYCGTGIITAEILHNAFRPHSLPVALLGLVLHNNA